MPLIAKQTPVVHPGHWGILQGLNQRCESPTACLGILELRGKFRVLTEDGYDAVGNLEVGDHVVWHGEALTGFGPGLKTQTGNGFRFMAPDELWGLVVSWLVPQGVTLNQLTKIVDDPPEGDLLFDHRQSFLETGATNAYSVLNQLDTLQVRALVSGALFAVQAWPTLWRAMNARETYLLRHKLEVAAGRWLAHMGIIVNESGELLPGLAENVKRRLTGETGYLPLSLPVTRTKLNVFRYVTFDTGALYKVVGFSIEGLALPVLT
jgi:hypothetical protein